MSALRLVGDSAFDVDIFDAVPSIDDCLDDLIRWRRERMEQPGICRPCQRTTDYGIRPLHYGPGGRVVPRCLRCFQTGVFEFRGAALHLVAVEGTDAYPPTRPAPEPEPRDPLDLAVDAVLAVLVSSISAVDAHQGQAVATSRRIRRHAEEAVLEGVTPSSIARRWAEQKVTKVWAGVELAELILDRAMSGRAVVQHRTTNHTSRSARAAPRQPEVRAVARTGTSAIHDE